jgi:hypothetical protein
MQTIEVDFEVYKALTVRRETVVMTENDVIRNLLGLNTKNDNIDYVDDIDGINDLVESLLSSWTIKGVTFPKGTKFRAEYKARMYYGEVQNGELVVDGKRFKSPSSAATEITKNSVNGWKFWECKLPTTSTWRLISSLKKS